MAALASASTERPASGLMVANVEDQGRLCRIYSEVHGWYLGVNQLELGKSTDDFDSSIELNKRQVSNYYNVAQKTAQVLGCKLGLYGNDHVKKFKQHQILAAYDSFGNLQGVAVVKLELRMKKLVAEIKYLVTAIWNMPFPNPKNDYRTKGAGTCLVSCITQIPNLTAILVDSTGEAEEFYTKRSFIKVPNLLPKTEGAWCVMILSKNKFSKVQQLVEGQLTSRDQLPYTILHYRSRNVNHLLEDLKESSSCGTS